jgi:hypothetical protein
MSPPLPPMSGRWATPPTEGAAMIRLLSCLAALLAFSVAATAAEPERVVTTDPHSQPESLTVAPDGSLILGSASEPVI